MHTKIKNAKNNKEFEDTKEVIEIRKSKDRKRNYSLCCV